MKKTIAFILSILLIIPFMLINTHASDDFFLDKSAYKYTLDDGLPGNQINDICATDNGLIWMGSYTGLVRYDGMNFVTYEKEGDISLLSIMSVEADGNNLYIGTQTGLILYDFTGFKQIELGDNYKVSSIATNDSSIILGTNNGLLEVNKETKQVTTLAKDNIISVSTSGNKIFYGSEEKKLMVYYNGTSQEINTNGFEAKTVCAIENKVYLGGYTGDFSITTNDISIKKSLGIETEINSFYLKNDVLYIGSDAGLFIYQNNTISKVTDVELTSISNIISDYQNNIWISSSSGGVAKIVTNQFIDLYKEYGLENNEALKSVKVNAFTSYKGLYYIGTDTGLIKLNPQTSEIETIISSRIRGIITNNDKLYIATYNSSAYDLAVYDGTTLTNITGFYMQGDEANPEAGKVRCISKHNDVIIVGTNYGISIVKNDTVYKTIKLDNEPLSIYCTNNKIYVCEDVASVNIYDYELNLEKKILKEQSAPLKCLVVNNTLVYSENNVLYAVDLTKDSKRIISDFNQKGSITELFMIGTKIYIATTTCELFIVEKDDILTEGFKYVTLGKANGMANGATANGNGYYDASTSTYFFVTPVGIYKLNLANIDSTSIPLKITINEIKVDDSSYYPNQSIDLDKNTSRVTIDFSIINYLAGKKKTIYYKLDGVDKDFQTLNGDENSISYTNLSGGKYQFHIYVTDDTGNTTSETIDLNLVKNYKFTETPIFWILIGLAIIASISLTAVAIVHSRTKKANERVELERGITREAILAMATAIDAKDKYTNGHSVRVGAYSRIIAENMGFTGIELENIYYTALLHDVGKIGVPDIVLNKPSRLTDEEFAIIKSHTTVGAEILQNFTAIPHIIDGAKYHHEKYNGSGYPEGLVGENIPLISRIICAADCYDAMATERVYKPPFDKEKIISEFKRCSGTQFDPQIAELVVKLIEEGKIYPIDANQELVKFMKPEQK